MKSARIALCSLALLSSCVATLAIVSPTASAKSLDMAKSLDAAETPIIAPLQIYIVGDEGRWRVHYHDSNGPTATPDAVILPLGGEVELYVTARDAIYDVSIPALDLRFAGIPGRIEHLVIDTRALGVFETVCHEGCAADAPPLTIEVAPIDVFQSKAPRAPEP